jgi:hypothetical protein
LPRGAGVEWHAHLGGVGGPVEVSFDEFLIGEKILIENRFMLVAVVMVGQFISVNLVAACGLSLWLIIRVLIWMSWRLWEEESKLLG